MKTTSVDKARKLPKGTTCDWQVLLNEVLENRGLYCVNASKGSSTYSNRLVNSILRGMNQICHIDNEVTDTQVGVWADINERTVSGPLLP